MQRRAHEDLPYGKQFIDDDAAVSSGASPSRAGLRVSAWVTVGITVTNTFVASANCIRYCGGRPRMVDVDPETGLMSKRRPPARM